MVSRSCVGLLHQSEFCLEGSKSSQEEMGNKVLSTDTSSEFDYGFLSFFL